MTLVLGLAVTCGAAAAVAFAQDQFDLLPSGFDLNQAATALGGLRPSTTRRSRSRWSPVSPGMLALETRASAAVGVAVSVTTIPAAAYLGVAAGVGEIGTAIGALGVLGMNVLMMVVGASGTLAVQRALNRRAAARRRQRATG